MTASLFHPQAERVTAFDQLTRDRLAGSLQYLAEAAGEHLSISDELLQAKLEFMREQQVLPEVYAAYYELVDAIQSGELVEAQRLFDDILDTIGLNASFQVIPFKDPERDATSRHYLTQIDTDSAVPFTALPAPKEEFERAKLLIEQSMELLAECSASLHDEIDALLNRVMVGAGPTEKDAFTFDGASAPGLWGGIMLNALTQKDIVDMAQTLAHESCHNLLFGYCIEDKLVRNPDEERHASPLRHDPRPLDGIYHATFVVARMHYALEQMDGSARLGSEFDSKIKEEKKQREINFYDGLATLKAHADYTDIGRQLMDDAEAYMNQATGRA